MTDQEKLTILLRALKRYAQDGFWEYGCGCCCVPKDSDGHRDWDRLGEASAGDLARNALKEIDAQ